MNKFDKNIKYPQYQPQIYTPNIELNKSTDIFNYINESNIDLDGLLYYSINNQIPLYTINDQGNNLIHETIKLLNINENTKINIIKVLVQNNVNPNQPNKYNMTPLHYACLQQSNNLIEYLLSELKVNPNYADNNGFTPIHYILIGKEDETKIEEIEPTYNNPKDKFLYNKDNIIIIKQKLWNLLLNKDYNLTFINGTNILDTIYNSINYIIDNDKYIIDKITKNNELLYDINNIEHQKNNSDLYYLDTINSTINTNNNIIIKKINDKITNNHNTNIKVQPINNNNSWSPYPDYNELTLLNEDTKIKIKNYINEKIDNIKNFYKNYKITDINYKIFYNILKNAIESKINDIFNNDVLNQTEFNKLNDQFKHDLAINNSSPIIDFDNLKYAGSCREITININSSRNTDDGTLYYNGKSIYDNIHALPQANEPPPEFTRFTVSQKIYDNFKKLLELPTILKQLLYLLSIPISYNNINNIDNIDNIYSSLIANIDYDYLFLNSNDIKYIKSCKEKLNISIKLFIFFYIYFIYYCYYIIIYNNIDNNNTIIKDFYDKINENKYNTNSIYKIYFMKLIAWSKRYLYLFNKEQKDIPKIIFEMWCDIHSKFSDNNLVCNIPFNLLMLISGLQNNRINLIQSVINSYKPHLISHLFSLYYDKKVAFVSSLILLLNDNVDLNFINIIFDDHENIDFINNLNINNKLKYFSIIFYKYIINGNINIDNDDIEIQNFYNFYKKDQINEKDIICKIIMNLYEDMKDKLLKQTIIDIIYFIRIYKINKINNITDISCLTVDIDKMLNKIKNINELNPTKYKLQPSYYGLYNIIYIDNKNEGLYEFSKKHFKISHILGLYYEGLLCNIKFEYNKLNTNLNINLKQEGYVFNYNKFNLITFPQRIMPVILNYITKRITKITGNPYFERNFKRINTKCSQFLQLILKFDYIYLQTESQIKKKNNIPGDEYYIIGHRIPTIINYYLLLMFKINIYQKLIKTNIQKIYEILSDLIKGNIKDYNKIYNQYYLNIVFYSNILKKFIESFNKCTDSIKIKLKDYITNNINLPDIKYEDYNKNITDSLNTINSLYFIYYFIFKQNKKIILDKFNNYLLPTTNHQNKNLNYIFNNKPLGNLDNIFQIGGSKIFGSNIQYGDESSNLFDNIIAQMGGALDANTEYNFHPNVQFTDYNEYVNQFLKKSIFSTKYEIIKQSYVKNKDNTLPQSIIENISDFYNLSLIEIIKKIILDIENKKDEPIFKEIYTELKLIVNSTKLDINSNEYKHKMLMGYEIISNLITEIMKEQLNIYIKKYINNYNNKDIDKDFYYTLKNDSNFKIDNTNINFTSITSYLENLNNYSFINVKNDENSLKYILYNNDFNNINNISVRKTIDINIECIKTLLQNKCLPYTTKFSNNSSIYLILKSYNYKIIKDLNNINIHYGKFESNKIFTFMVNENLYNINRILGKLNNKSNLNLFFNNITNKLATECIDKIINLDVEISFNIITYLILEKISEYLLNINNNYDYNIDEIIDVLKVLKLDINNIKKNYLFDNLQKYNIPNKYNTILIQQIIKDKEQEVNILNNNILKLENMKQNTKSNLDLLNNNLDKELNKLKKEVFKINDQIRKLNNYYNIVKDELLELNNNDNNIDNIFDNTIILDNKNYNIIFEAWKIILNDELFEDNYNLLILHLLFKQQKILNNLKIGDKFDNLKLINNIFKHFAHCIEDYFNNPNNNINNFIFKLLVYVTQISIGTFIENILRTYFTEYFMNNYIIYKINSNNDTMIIEINNLVNNLLTLNIKNSNKSILDILYSELCPIMVKISIHKFNDSNNTDNLSDLLTIFINHLNNLPIIISEQGIQNIQNKILTYNYTIDKIIKYWNVNIENIFTFIINHFRCMQTFINLFDY